jgi:hypothetical protein
MSPRTISTVCQQAIKAVVFLKHYVAVGNVYLLYNGCHSLVCKKLGLCNMGIIFTKKATRI